MGGLLGDFIHQLYIVYDHWKKTREKGIVYFSDRGDRFRSGVKQTMLDLGFILKLQPYIESWKIYENEPYDVDCTEWRNYLADNNYWATFNDVYQIEFGKDQWLFNIPVDVTWNNKTIINTTDYRFPKIQFSEYKDVIYVSLEKRYYDHFVEKTGLKVPYYGVTSLYELAVIINTCKLFVGSWSAPLSLCMALHKPCHVENLSQMENVGIRNVKYL